MPGRAIPCLGQFLHLLGEEVCDVRGLGGVGFDVEQLPLRIVDPGRIRVQRQQFPAVPVEPAVTAELGVLLRVRGRLRRVAQDLGDADAVALLRGKPVPMGRRLESGEVQEGRGDVGDVRVVLAQPGVAVGAPEPGRPGQQERHPDTAGERLPLVEPERRVGRLAPAARVVDSDLLRADQFLVVRDVAHPVGRHRPVHELTEVRTGSHRTTFGRAAVVGGEHDDGVVGFAEFVEGVEDPAHALVDAVDHGGVDLLVPGEP